ncbi:MAG: EscU/YscU/HrcU family type III secretion system export apparatus switch protein, partial [Kiritimatiellae bacterium]|nr:EscU/YscU/HrcU family type III secretion system export apparatus switch protein [Kiritimatiellia bacterium]
SVPELLTMCYGTVDDIFPCLKLMLKRLAVYTAFGYIVIAIVDRLFQGRDFTKQMMMTKDEVKREYKEMEGSAEIKQAQRRFRDEIMNGPDPATAAKKANVVVTNPTHLAVGIRYRADEAPLPRICALGAGKTAKIIRETALAEGIPVMEDRPLARALYAEGRIEDFIPDSLIEPVAEVLKWAKRIQDARREEDELDAVDLDDIEAPESGEGENA